MTDFADLESKRMINLFKTAGKPSNSTKKRQSKPKSKNQNTELKQQIALFKWVDTQPLIREVAFHIPNSHIRDPIRGAIYRRAGVKAGVPDIFIARPVGIWHGMFIELKKDGTERATEVQLEMLKRLAEQGYNCQVCYGWEDAKNSIINYLGI